ncbi:MAG TPA: SET domain-containing protein-lysine N-methyltransferase [Drouetiella sp.]
MLLIKTTLSPSPIHGSGLYAAEPIAKGTDMWRFQEGFDIERTSEEVEALPEVAKEWMKRYGYLDHHLNTYILSFDDARFINHSEDPNMRPDYKRHRCAVGVAARDIAKGEEITIDYREIENCAWLCPTETK